MNLNDISPREKYKEFYRKNIEQMQLLVRDNRTPLTMKDIIERRINSSQVDWRNNYFDTCDAIVQFNGEIKVIKNCNVLKSMNKDTKIENGGIKITEKQFKNLKGKKFKIKGMKLNEYLTKKEAKSHPIWKYLLGNLLNKYADLVFSINSEDNMAIWTNTENLILRAWCVGRLGSGSDAGGRGGVAVMVASSV